MQSISAQLDDFQKWRRSQEDFTLLDYVMCVATPDLLFGFSELLMPSLTFHDGNYFLGSNFEVELYDKWMNQLNDPVAVQKVLNHIHISTLFQQQSVSDEVARAAGERIAACWSLTLRDRGLTATVAGTTLDDVEITFFRDRR